MAEHVVEKDAVAPQFQQNAVPVGFQKLFRRILAGEMVFLLNTDCHPFSRKKLIPDALFQLVNVLLVHQSRAVDVDADHAPVPCGGDALYLYHLQKPAHMFRDM